MDSILSADDEYLTGLTNKGTVKRAYKDMESGEISAEYGDSEINVSVGGEKCTRKVNAVVRQGAYAGIS